MWSRDRTRGAAGLRKRSGVKTGRPRVKPSEKEGLYNTVSLNLEKSSQRLGSRGMLSRKEKGFGIRHE